MSKPTDNISINIIYWMVFAISMVFVIAISVEESRVHDLQRRVGQLEQQVRR